MAYRFYLDGVALPVTPSKVTLKIKNKNTTARLINDEEINILKSAGLTEIRFSTMIPHVSYPFSFYPDGFRPVTFYLEKLEKLKMGKKPFRFLIVRTFPDGKPIFDTDMRVSLEDYDVTEDAVAGQSLTVNITLKQYTEYGTKHAEIKKGAAAEPTTTKKRPEDNAPAAKTYTVVKGDSLWAIAKKQLGNGARYMEIYNLNRDKIKNPNLIYAGQVLTLPR